MELLIIEAKGKTVTVLLRAHIIFNYQKYLKGIKIWSFYFCLIIFFDWKNFEVSNIPRYIAASKMTRKSDIQSRSIQSFDITNNCKHVRETVNEVHESLRRKCLVKVWKLLNDKKIQLSKVESKTSDEFLHLILKNRYTSRTNKYKTERQFRIYVL